MTTSTNLPTGPENTSGITPTRDETSPTNQVWRIRKVKSALGGWAVERGWWRESEKRIRDGCGPMRFVATQQTHFHNEAKAKLALEQATQS